MATRSEIDPNTVPFDAPLSFPTPDSSWVKKQSNKGTKWTKASVPAAELTGKFVIVTGGNNGIGRESALQMAAWGANLILACRTPPPHESHPNTVVEECRAAAQKAGKDIEVEWWQIDMASLESVEAFAKRWNETGRPIVRSLLYTCRCTGAYSGAYRIFSAITRAWEAVRVEAPSIRQRTVSR